MKNLLTLTVLFLAFSASAQIVNFPDPQFKAALLNYTPAIDTNGDGEIQVSEAQVVSKIMTLYGNFSDMTGISSFINLDSLWISTVDNLHVLDLSGMTTIRWVRAEMLLYLNSVNVSGCSSLNYLDLKFSGQSSPHITSFNITGVNKLKYLDCGSVHIPELDLQQCDSLEIFKLDNVNIGVFNISGLTKIQNISLSGEIGSFIARNCTGLRGIDNYSLMGWGNVNDLLDLTGCINLESLGPFALFSTFLDLSSCINLRVLTLGPANLRYLNMKNGSALDSIWLPLGNTPIYVCTDDFETDNVAAYLSDFSYYNDSITVSSLCSPLPGGSYNTILGKVSIDMNNNGCDNGDAGMPNVPIRITEGTNSIVRYTAPSGDYRHYDFAGNFTLTPDFPNPYFNISPATTNVIFDTANSIVDTADFCITPNGIHNQLDITFLPIGPARPGFTAGYLVYFRNWGNTTLSGNVQVNFDNSRMNYNFSSVAPSSQSSGQLTWNYSNLAPFEDREIYVQFNLLPPPVNNIADTLTYLAIINPVAGDEIPLDNSFILPQAVTGSYDPNDKLCLEGNKIDLTSLNKPLHYIIRFQNMGTDTAFNVVVTDTLTSNVDWESFDFIGSSHPCQVTRKNNKLEFYFENIKLPYQAINDAGSNGFVAFKIKPKNTLAVGDSINNTASIYFDFNLPVQTNKASTVVSLLAPVPVKLEYFSLSSNDESNLLTWKVATSDLTTTFGIERSSDGIHFSNIGNITATAQRCQLPFSFIDDNPFNGKNYYRIKVTDANGVSFYSKVLATGKTKSGFEINAVVSNQNTTTLYLNVSKDQTVHLKMFAADGRLVYSQSKMIIAGTNTLTLQTGNLPKGVYTLVVYTNDGEAFTKRFLK